MWSMLHWVDTAYVSCVLNGLVRFDGLYVLKHSVHPICPKLVVKYMSFIVLILELMIMPTELDLLLL